MQSQRSSTPQHSSHGDFSETHDGSWAGIAIESLHKRIVQLIGAGHPHFLEAQQLLGQATEAFFKGNWEESHAFAHRGIDLLASSPPPKQQPEQPPPIPPLTPPTVLEGIVRGLAITKGNECGNVLLKVEMVAPDGSLVQLEFREQTQAKFKTYFSDTWLAWGSLVFLEFSVNNGNLRLLTCTIIYRL